MEGTSELVSPAHVVSKLDEYLISQLKDPTIEENFINGYFEKVENFNNITMEMKERGYTFSVRDSEIRKKRLCGKEGDDNEHANTVFYELKVMNIKFFGLPFTVDKTTHYQCTYGCKYYKSKAKKIREESDVVKRKRRSVISKKMGCMAKMTLKKVTVYPSYALNAIKNWRQKKLLIEKLRKDLTSDSSQVVKTCRYYICVSLQSCHNHPAIIKDNLLPKTKKSSKEPTRKVPKKKEPNQEGNWVTLYSSKDSPKTLTGQDATFFVKFPANTVTYSEMKPVTIEVEDFEVERVAMQDNPMELEAAIEFPLQEVQTAFKEKLKRLYTLSENCTNTALLFRLLPELVQVEETLINDIGYDPI